MTPAQLVALDAMRSAWDEATVQRMLKAERLAELLWKAVDAADSQDCGYCGSRQGNGNELACSECDWFSLAAELLKRLDAESKPQLAPSLTSPAEEEHFER